MLSDEQIRIIVNQFVKMGMKLDFTGQGLEIALFRNDDSWDLQTIEPRSPKLKDAELHFRFPDDLPEDNLDAAIELAGILSIRLHKYANNKKANAGKTPEQRKAAAKKAIEARWTKYRAEKAKAAENGLDK